jgi:hypothetical protein
MPNILVPFFRYAAAYILADAFQIVEKHKAKEAA